jgi:hypothetical protein
MRKSDSASMPERLLVNKQRLVYSPDNKMSLAAATHSLHCSRQMVGR